MQKIQVCILRSAVIYFAEGEGAFHAALFHAAGKIERSRLLYLRLTVFPIAPAVDEDVTSKALFSGYDALQKKI